MTATEGLAPPPPPTTAMGYEIKPPAPNPPVNVILPNYTNLPNVVAREPAEVSHFRARVEPGSLAMESCRFSSHSATKEYTHCRTQTTVA